MQPISPFQPTIEPAQVRPDEAILVPLTLPTQTYEFVNRQAKDARSLLFNWDISLTANNSLSVFCEGGIPEYWIVSIRPIATVKVSVFPNQSGTGIPYRLAGGSTLKLPGLNEYLTVVAETGSSAVVGTIVAVRGYKVHIDPGNLA